MSPHAVLKFTVNGEMVLNLSPAQLLENYLRLAQRNPGFPPGTWITCTLETPNFGVQSSEQIGAVKPFQSPEIMTNNLINKLRKPI